jgi:hypothetical protein
MEGREGRNGCSCNDSYLKMEVELHPKSHFRQLDMFYIRHVKVAALFNVLCGPTQFSKYTRCVAQNFPILINVKIQMHVK